MYANLYSHVKYSLYGFAYKIVDSLVEINLQMIKVVC